MSKQSKQTPTPPLVESDWSDHPATEWISNNKQYILWALAGLLIIVIITARLLMSRSSHAESDYLQAETDFNQFQQAAISSPTNLHDFTALNNLEKLIKNYPELGAKYDGAIAQTLIIENQPAKAEPFAHATFERTKNDFIKDFHTFAETSLIISAGDYKKALVQSQELQETLKEKSQNTDVTPLYLFNTLRLAMLHQQLGNQQEEAESWAEFQLLADQPQVSNLLKLFIQGNASLNQYIQKRKT